MTIHIFPLTHEGQTNPRVLARVGGFGVVLEITTFPGGATGYGATTWLRFNPDEARELAATITRAWGAGVGGHAYQYVPQEMRACKARVWVPLELAFTRTERGLDVVLDGEPLLCARWHMHVHAVREIRAAITAMGEDQ